MKATFIVRDKSDIFYHGGGHFKEVGLFNMQPRAQFQHLLKLAAEKLGVSIKIGPSNSFRDRVELNQMLRTDYALAFKLEHRRGYKLVTFTFTPLPLTRPHFTKPAVPVPALPVFDSL
jgi:hypothetical protein